MFDIPTIQNAITGLQTAGKIAQAMHQLSTSIEIKTQVIELQGAILSAQTSALAAQSEQFTMIQRVRELEEEVARIKAWEGEKQRYQVDASVGKESYPCLCVERIVQGNRTTALDMHKVLR